MMIGSMEEKIRISQFRADFKTKAHQHCTKKLQTFYHNSLSNGLHDDPSFDEEMINKAIRINDYLKSVRNENRGKVHCIRRSLSACNTNEKRNKYIVKPTILNATKTLWPMDPQLMQEADEFIARTLNLSNSKETPEHMETVGNHIVELGVVFGPERFYVKSTSSPSNGIVETLKEFNKNRSKIKQLSEVSVSTELPSPSLLAFCNEFDQVLKRVCYIRAENNNGFFLYDFDYGHVCHMDSFDYLALKHLPAELCVSQPSYSPVTLVNKVSEVDFTRYINNLRKTGFLYIVGFVGHVVQAATTSEVQLPNPCRRFCDYLYCEGDCFLTYEKNQIRRQNPQM